MRHLYLAEWRKHKGLICQALGRRVGVDRITVYRWERGERQMNPEKMRAGADALGIDPAALWRHPLQIDLAAPLPDYVPVTPPPRSFLARVAEWLFGGSKEAADV